MARTGAINAQEAEYVVVLNTTRLPRRRGTGLVYLAVPMELFSVF